MRRSRWLGGGLFGLAVGLAATALLGPLGAGVIRYRVSSRMLSQLKGVDLVSLVLVAPLCVVIGLLAMRGRRASPALALGPAVYVLYLFAEVIVGPDYLGVAGNSERFFPLFVTMLVVAGAVLVAAWGQIDASELGSTGRRSNRVAGGLFVALGAFLVVGPYLPGLADAMSAKPTSTDYLAGPTIFWTVALEDLGVIIPAMITIAGDAR